MTTSKTNVVKVNCWTSYGCGAEVYLIYPSNAEYISLTIAEDMEVWSLARAGGGKMTTDSYSIYLQEHVAFN